MALRLPAQEVRVTAGGIAVDSGRFTIVAAERDRQLAHALLAIASRNDTFPGLAQPVKRARIEIAPDAQRFRAMVGDRAPEWGAAVAFPAEMRIVMQGSRANASAGDPTVTLRHELAHLALYEALADVPPRWFDEGYAAFAAGEWGRDEALATNIALAVRGMPSLEALDAYFAGGSSRAQQGYALAHGAVAELAALDRARGLTLFLEYWKASGSFDQAVRQAYGMTGSAFEARWRATMRRRYGALALFADVTGAALVFLVMIGPLWVLRRRRDRARLAALLVAEEAQERREQESALAALLGTPDPFPLPPPPPASPGPPGGAPGRNDELIK